ncbi:MAG: twin-arginine translocase subunit TatC [Gammaproteobacteria bacterium]|nr:twin-arginine translocase subunit TatC [Gammaproteobacteria bacterium]
MTFVEHLIELRDRLLRVIISILVVLLCAAPFANDLYSILAEPLTSVLPEGTSMVAIKVASPFLAPFKMVLWLAIFLSVPVILYQGWAFVAPGLYQHEKKLVLPLAITSTFLFYLGMAFAYFVVFPLVFPFLVGYAAEGVTVATDISAYLDFVITIFFAFGIAFEVPVATIILCWAGITTPDDLVAKRPYIIVGAFVIGMFLTPPDMISQTLLALPMWGLFELGVIIARYYVKQSEEPDRYAHLPDADWDEEEHDPEDDWDDDDEKVDETKNVKTPT